MKISRIWSMPNGKTFKMKPIKEIICRHIKDNDIVLDPFANESSIKEHILSENYISNDLDSKYDCDYSVEAKEFLKMFDDNSVDVVLYDPPYSPRQVKEIYNNIDRVVTKEDTQSSYWSGFKDEITRVLKVGGKVISFGWNSGGIGMSRGFDIDEILLVPHGGNHNDTICTVEIKGRNI